MRGNVGIQRGGNRNFGNCPSRSHVHTSGTLGCGPFDGRPQRSVAKIFYRQKMSGRQKGKLKPPTRPHPNEDNKYHHRRHIASRWSPCWSLTAAAYTIGKSIVLCFFSYPGFVYTTGVSEVGSILPLLPSSR